MQFPRHKVSTEDFERPYDADEWEGDDADIPQTAKERQHCTNDSVNRPVLDPLPEAIGRRDEEVLKYNVVLVGTPGCGKSSLARCMKGDPVLFTKLPTVSPTIGINKLQYTVKLPMQRGADMTIDVVDCAGHPSYSGLQMLHYNNRSLFVLVWKISAMDWAGGCGPVGGATSSSFGSSFGGIFSAAFGGQHSTNTSVTSANNANWVSAGSARGAPSSPRRGNNNSTTTSRPPPMSGFECERLLSIVAAIYSKCPRARIVLVGTHAETVDASQLPAILSTMRCYVDYHLRQMSTDMSLQLKLVGNYAVSNKHRLAYSEMDKDVAPASKLSVLTAVIANHAYIGCVQDTVFDMGVVPGKVLALRDMLRAEKEQAHNLILLSSDLDKLFELCGITHERQRKDAIELLHCWGEVFITFRDSANTDVLLFPQFLRTALANVGSFMEYLDRRGRKDGSDADRSFLGMLEYSVDEAVDADCGELQTAAVLSTALSRVLFAPLVKGLSTEFFAALLKSWDESTMLNSDLDQQMALCLQLFTQMELLIPLEIEQPPRYLVPTLLRSHIPLPIKRFYHHIYNSQRKDLGIERGLDSLIHFSVLPHDFFARLQVRLRPYLLLIKAPVPECHMERQDELCPEAYFRRSIWKDAMIIGSQHSIVLIYTTALLIEGGYTTTTLPTSIRVVAPRLGCQLADFARRAIVDLITDAYPGIFMQDCLPCANPQCPHWFVPSILFTIPMETEFPCPVCRELQNKKRIIDYHEDVDNQWTHKNHYVTDVSAACPAVSKEDVDVISGADVDWLSMEEDQLMQSLATIERVTKTLMMHQFAET